MKKKILISACAIMFSVMLAGCDNTGNEPVQTPVPMATVTPTQKEEPKPTATAVNGTQIKEQKPTLDTYYTGEMTLQEQAELENKINTLKELTQ